MNQVLIIGSSNSGKLTLVKEIFGDQIEIPKDLNSHSGLIFNDVNIKTKYFTTKIGIWIDEFDKRDGNIDIEEFSHWCEEMLSEEAKEVRDALKGVIFTFNTNDEDTISYVSKASSLLNNLFEQHFDEWDGIKLAVGFQKSTGALPKDKIMVFDDIWLDNGFEFIWFEEESQKDLKMGKERIMEAFEANDWRNKQSESEPKEAKRDLDDKELEQMFTRLLDDYDDKELKEQDLNYDELVTKLQNAKFEIGKLDKEEDKRIMAQEAISNVIRFL